MSRDERLDLFGHLGVLVLENRSFDELCSYPHEHDEPKHFIPDMDIRAASAGPSPSSSWSPQTSSTPSPPTRASSR